MADEEEIIDRLWLLHFEISAPLERVWRALRDPAEIAKWFGWDSPTLKDEIEYIFLQHATGEPQTFHVSHVKPPSKGYRLVFGEYEGVTYAFELEPARDGVRLHLVRLNSPKPGDYEDVLEGWISFLEQLRFWLERHAGAERRSIYISRKTGPKLGRLLGVHGLADARPGRAFVAELPGGERIDGNVWHHSRHQVGVTVRAWGDVLMVVLDGASEGGSVTISTYGMDDAAFRALEAQWVARLPETSP